MYLFAIAININLLGLLSCIYISSVHLTVDVQLPPETITGRDVTVTRTHQDCLPLSAMTTVLSSPLYPPVNTHNIGVNQAGTVISTHQIGSAHLFSFGANK